MQMGLLWFDNDPNRDVATKAKDAARRYRDKFGVSPDTCYVNSGALGSEAVLRFEYQGEVLLRLAPASNILAHHFWVGVEERAERRTELPAQVMAS